MFKHKGRMSCKVTANIPASLGGQDIVIFTLRTLFSSLPELWQKQAVQPSCDLVPSLVDWWDRRAASYESNTCKDIESRALHFTLSFRKKKYNFWWVWNVTLVVKCGTLPSVAPEACRSQLYNGFSVIKRNTLLLIVRLSQLSLAPHSLLCWQLDSNTSDTNMTN